MFNSTSFKHIGDLTSLAVVVGTLKEWLPHIAALISIIWTLIRIYEWFRYRMCGHNYEIEGELDDSRSKRGRKDRG